VAGDDAVARDLLLLHSEVGAAVDDEAVDLDEAPGIEEQIDALAGGELASVVLLLDALHAPAHESARVGIVEPLDGGGRGLRRRGHGRSYNAKWSP
jgi:hypothetical protein